MDLSKTIGGVSLLRLPFKDDPKVIEIIDSAVEWLKKYEKTLSLMQLLKARVIISPDMARYPEDLTERFVKDELKKKIIDGIFDNDLVAIVKHEGAFGEVMVDALLRVIPYKKEKFEGGEANG